MNPILRTDSYKLGHWKQYQPDTEVVYSYLESRVGSDFPYALFFGLQALLRRIEGSIVHWGDLEEAADYAAFHFGTRDIFNYAGWQHIIEEHQGRLPLEIRAVPEGLIVPTGNVLMTIQNTCPKCFWVTNALESYLLKVWYPTTVATQSRVTKSLIADYLDRTASSKAGLPFMLHDFGYRGASSDETAAAGGAAHLVNFKGTDTLVGMVHAREFYNAELASLAFSVPATEHSVMTALGEKGEKKIVEQLLTNYPSGILSIVGDSYNIYDFVAMLGSIFQDQILKRDGKIVVRPDSITRTEKTPAEVMVTISRLLWDAFGGEVNKKGFRVLDPHIGVLWGDGLELHDISTILQHTSEQGFSSENYVFGQGGGLLQKVNRDTMSFAIKSSAQRRDRVWYAISKNPLDLSKKSKTGKLKLIKNGEKFETVEASLSPDHDILERVFEDGMLFRDERFETVRSRAELA